jgi:hypothetical protein
VTAFRRHAWAYAAAVVVLSIVNWFTGDPWWSFWPLAAWGPVLAGHYLFYKTRTVNAEWVEERTADVHSKSYDAGHIDRIAADQKDPKP